VRSQCLARDSLLPTRLGAVRTVWWVFGTELAWRAIVALDLIWTQYTAAKMKTASLGRTS